MSRMALTLAHSQSGLVGMFKELLEVAQLIIACRWAHELRMIAVSGHVEDTLPRLPSCSNTALHHFSVICCSLYLGECATTWLAYTSLDLMDLNLEYLLKSAKCPKRPTMQFPRFS